MLAIGFICFICMLWAFWGYSYLESNLIFDKICQPTYLVILGIVSLGLGIYAAYAENLGSFKFIMTTVLGSIACAFVLILVSYAMLAISNEIFGGGENIVVQGQVIEARDWKGKNHGKVHHSVIIYSPQLQRNLTLDVPRGYNNGEFFSREMRLGRWGIVYKHPF